MNREDERIEWLRNVLADGPREGIAFGVGDDAAILHPPAGESIVSTVDAQVENVHFERAWLTFDEIGYRATMAAASDLAAMGARPFCALSSLILPNQIDDTSFQQIVAGQKRATREIDGAIVGGNLARGGEISISTTWLGRTLRAVCRTGARPGDHILVAGALGLAHVGLLALQRSAGGEKMAAAISAWKSPRARILEGVRMAHRAHAAIDLSDGLAIDLNRLARSSDVRVDLDPNAIEGEAATIADACSALGIIATDAVLYGGEDYSLLIASPCAIDGFRAIGRVREGVGVYLSGAQIDARGFDHFAQSAG